MQCPYCGQQHPDGVEFCPATGNRLITRQNGRRGFFLGLGIFSSLLITVSVLMLFLNRNGTSRVSANYATGLPRDTSTGQVNPLLNNIESVSTIEPTSTALPTSMPTETPVPLPSPVELKVNPLDGVEIVLIPVGEFLMGSNPADDPYFWGAETPEHTANIDAFWIYRTEVTQWMYSQCVEQKKCPIPVKINDPVAKQYGNSRFDDYPVVMITWQSASAYCQWAGGRLPTEAEWEKAARGTDGRLFPWGNEPNADGLANYTSDSPSPVGSFPAGSSPYGVYDMAGNVLEWVNDFFESGYYQYSPLESPTGPASGNRRVIRGGAFNQHGIPGLRTVARASRRPTDTLISIGFRCVIDTPE